MRPPPPARLLRVAGNLYTAGRIGPQTMTRLLRACRARRLRHANQPVYLEASPFLRGCVDLLEPAFGPVQLIHLVRHPASYIASYINFGAFSGIKGLASEYFPYWMLKPEHVEADAAYRWRSMSPVERIAWRWAALNRRLSEAGERLGARYLRLRYEDLFDPEARGLETIATWLGLHPPPALMARAEAQRVNASVARRLPPIDSWAETDRQVVREHCGSLAARYGYTL